MNRLKFLIIILMTLGTHAYSQIVVTNPGTGPVRPPIDPPPVDNPIPVRPTTPDGTGIFDGSLYEYCGPAGYKCNLMRTDAVSKMLDESRAYSAKQLKAHKDSLDAEMAKLDSDLNAARSGVVGENSPAGQVLKGKLANAANTKAQAIAVSDETLAFQIQASQEQSSSIDVGLGLAFKEQDKKEYREEVRKVELVVANRFLDAKLKTELNRADAIESQINQGNFSNKQQRLELVSAGRAAFQISAQSLAEGDLGKSDFALKVGTTMLDVAISVTPILGWGKDLYEASFGKNLITGEELNGFERSMAVIGVLTGGLGSKLAIAGKGIILARVIKSARGADEAVEAAKIVKNASDAIESARKVPSVDIPWGSGKAVQEISKEAIEARAKVEGGQVFYRAGTKGKSNTGPDAQFWSLEHPTKVGYGDKYGIPPENMKQFDFIETASLKEGSNFITRAAPPVGTSKGGGIEIVVPPNSVKIESHVTL